MVARSPQIVHQRLNNRTISWLFEYGSNPVQTLRSTRYARVQSNSACSSNHHTSTSLSPNHRAASMKVWRFSVGTLDNDSIDRGECQLLNPSEASMNSWIYAKVLTNQFTTLRDFYSKYNLIYYSRYHCTCMYLIDTSTVLNNKYVSGLRA